MVFYSCNSDGVNVRTSRQICTCFQTPLSDYETIHIKKKWNRKWNKTCLIQRQKKLFYRFLFKQETHLRSHDLRWMCAINNVKPLQHHRTHPPNSSLLLKSMLCPYEEFGTINSAWGRPHQRVSFWIKVLNSKQNKTKKKMLKILFYINSPEGHCGPTCLNMK